MGRSTVVVAPMTMSDDVEAPAPRSASSSSSVVVPSVVPSSLARGGGSSVRLLLTGRRRSFEEDDDDVLNRELSQLTLTHIDHLTQKTLAKEYQRTLRAPPMYFRHSGHKAHGLAGCLPVMKFFVRARGFVLGQTTAAKLGAAVVVVVGHEPSAEDLAEEADAMYFWTNAFVDAALESEWVRSCGALAVSTVQAASLVAVVVLLFTCVDVFEVGEEPALSKLAAEWLYVLYFPAVAPLIAASWGLPGGHAFCERWHRSLFAFAVAVLLAGAQLKLARRSAWLAAQLGVACDYSDAAHSTSIRALPSETVATTSALFVIAAQGACVVAIKAELVHVFAVTAVGCAATLVGRLLARAGDLGGARPATPPYYTWVSAAATLLLALWACKLVNAGERLRWSSLREATMRRLQAEARLVVVHRDAAEVERRACDAFQRALEEAAVQKKKSDDDDLHHLRGDAALESIPVSDLTLRHKLGEGAFGEAILCEWRGTLVVLKRMPRRSITQRNMALFADELRTMCTLRHPNVVQLMGACFDDACNVGFVLEYAPNGDLHDVLLANQANPTFSWAEPLRRMAADVARGLAYLHGHQPPVIHRDLKSKNVLVSQTFACKVADFGLSSVLEEEGNKEAAPRAMTNDDEGQGRRSPPPPPGGGVTPAPRRENLVGTPPWMAPELVRGAEGGAAADMYAYGVVLCEMANKAPPYSTAADRANHAPQQNWVALLAAVNGRGLRPALVGPMDDDVKIIKDACLHADRSRRPSARAVLATLCPDSPQDHYRDEADLKREAETRGNADSLWTAEDTDVLEDW